MRDINRIDKIIDVLRDIWKLVPDWRFGQVIENFKRDANLYDMFYVEDDDILEILESYYECVDCNYKESE